MNRLPECGGVCTSGRPRCGSGLAAELPQPFAQQEFTLAHASTRTPEVREWLANKGYNRQMGARPMARLIEEFSKLPGIGPFADMYVNTSQGDGESIMIDPKTGLRLGAADPRKHDSRAMGH